LASLLLFGFMYWQTCGYISSAIDEWLARESSTRAVASAPELADMLNARAAADPDGRRPFALFKADGSWLAGNEATLPPTPMPMDEPFRFTLQRGGEAAPFRGMTHRLPSGEILLVARDMRDINQFRELLLGAMASGGVVVLLLGLAGAVIAGAGALGRIDGVARAIERIVNGDLSQRLPSRGTAGDLDRLIHVVNRMLDEIERLMHEVKGVTEDIAHDLRTPLTRLLAGLERVRRRGTSAAEYETTIDEAIVETKDILATFSALLRIAEVESGARRAGFTSLDLDTVAADVAELYEPVAEGKGISLSLEREGGARAEIAGDPSLLFEAISNLVDNAIKYSPQGSRLTLRVLAASDRLGIEVSDTGPGIPAAERDAVLRRFHRVEKCRSTPGCGLGLSLVAAVARLHDLHLAIEDARPGCRVTLWRERVDDPPGQAPVALDGLGIGQPQPV
jgi:signal transduction histidine kinase